MMCAITGWASLLVMSLQWSQKAGLQKKLSPAEAKEKNRQPKRRFKKNVEDGWKKMMSPCIFHKGHHMRRENAEDRTVL